MFFEIPPVVDTMAERKYRSRGKVSSTEQSGLRGNGRGMLDGIKASVDHEPEAVWVIVCDASFKSR